MSRKIGRIALIMITFCTFLVWTNGCGNKNSDVIIASLSVTYDPDSTGMQIVINLSNRNNAMAIVEGWKLLFYRDNQVVAQLDGQDLGAFGEVSGSLIDIDIYDYSGITVTFSETGALDNDALPDTVQAVVTVRDEANAIYDITLSDTLNIL